MLGLEGPLLDPAPPIELCTLGLVIVPAPMDGLLWPISGDASTRSTGKGGTESDVRKAHSVDKLKHDDFLAPQLRKGKLTTSWKPFPDHIP